MTYASIETSRTLGAPITLYLFTYGTGAGDYYGCTDHTQAVTYEGKTYAPTPIARESYTAASTLDRSSMTVNLARDSAIGELFSGWPASSVIRLRIYEGHYNSTDYRLKWSGRVINVGRSNQQISLKVETLQTSLKRVGLRRNWQYGCPHVLFGTACGANKAASSVTATVSAVNNPLITLPTGWQGAKDPQRFVGGMVEWTGSNGRKQIRTIMSYVGPGTLRLSGGVDYLAAGMQVTVSLGCRKTMEDCQDVFSNIHNFGGQPWIPTDNPIGIKNNFY